MFADLYPAWIFFAGWVLAGMCLFGGLWCLFAAPRWRPVEACVVLDDDGREIWLWTKEGGWEEVLHQGEVPEGEVIYAHPDSEGLALYAAQVGRFWEIMNREDDDGAD